MSVKPWAQALPEFEGRYNFMYLDGGGVVTTGVGHALFSATDAVTLFGDPAAAKEWEDVKALPPGRLASFYETMSTVRLTDPQIDQLTAYDMDKTFQDLCRLHPTSASWPTGPKDAACDILYNTGSPFPKMFAACDAGDWDTAAKESHRIEKPSPNGIQPERNEWAKNAILSATEA